MHKQRGQLLRLHFAIADSHVACTPQRGAFSSATSGKLHCSWFVMMLACAPSEVDMETLDTDMD
jgi:hypothetical protein